MEFKQFDRGFPVVFFGFLAAAVGFFAWWWVIGFDTQPSNWGVEGRLIGLVWAGLSGGATAFFLHDPTKHQRG